MADRRLWLLAMSLFIVIGFLLWHRRVLFCLFFFSVMTAAFLYDHRFEHGLIKGAYQFDYSQIKEVDDYLREHGEDTFLLVQLPSTDKADDVHYNSKIADTFLVYPNTIFASGKRITGIETDKGIDLKAVDMDDLGISIVGAYDLDSADYIVLTTEMVIDESECEKVLENSLFNIYRLKDTTKLPYMERANQWNIPGKVRFQPEAGFASRYSEDDRMVYVSDDTPDYVLYGPYVTLKSGKYEITINYSYSGDYSGKIGHMDLMGSLLDPSENEATVYADRDSVSVTFDLAEECENFEVRLFAEVPGIEVRSVEVITAALKITEASDCQLYQYFGSNNLLVREEYYTLDGEKLLNSSGFYAVDYLYEYGNRVKCCYYDTENQLVKNSSGFAIVRYSYNHLRQVIREDCFDEDDRPVICFGGYAAIEYDRDENGYPIEYRFFGKDGEPVDLPTGQAMARSIFNEKHQIIRDEYYNIEYEPFMRTDGFFALEYEYDDAGNRTEFRHYNTDGELTLNTSGYAIRRVAYNEAGQVIREEYYDESDQPVTCTNGYSMIEYTHDANGDVTECRYLGVDGKELELSS